MVAPSVAAESLEVVMEAETLEEGPQDLAGALPADVCASPELQPPAESSWEAHWVELATQETMPWESPSSSAMAAVVAPVVALSSSSPSKMSLPYHAPPKQGHHLATRSGSRRQRHQNLNDFKNVSRCRQQQQ